MMKINIFNILEILIGFSSGIVIGGAFVAILTVLGIIPRLIQLSRSKYLVNVYSVSIILGTVFGTYMSFTGITFHFHFIFLVFWGGIHGIFNGMLAAALIEILNVFPLLSKRVGLEKYLLLLLTAIVIGKIAGSLFQWLYFVD